MPILSIITINYNNASGLKKTIASVVNQTYKNFEYIVIDGNSNDKSIEIIKQNKQYINYWISEKDSGIYNAMNKGIKQATGDYCLFLNSGDYLKDENALERVLQNKFEEDIICFDLNFLSSKNKFSVHKYPDKIKLSTFYFGSIGHGSTFIKRNLFDTFGVYNEQNEIVSDWEFFVKVLIVENCSYKHYNDNFSVFVEGGISSSQENFLKIELERTQVLQKYFPNILDDYKELSTFRHQSISGVIKKIKNRISE